MGVENIVIFGLSTLSTFELNLQYLDCCDSKTILLKQKTSEIIPFSRLHKTSSEKYDFWFIPLLPDTFKFLQECKWLLNIETKSNEILLLRQRSYVNNIFNIVTNLTLMVKINEGSFLNFPRSKMKIFGFFGAEIEVWKKNT